MFNLKEFLQQFTWNIYVSDDGYDISINYPVLPDEVKVTFNDRIRTLVDFCNQNKFDCELYYSPYDISPHQFVIAPKEYASLEETIQWCNKHQLKLNRYYFNNRIYNLNQEIKHLEELKDMIEE